MPIGVIDQLRSRLDKDGFVVLPRRRRGDQWDRARPVRPSQRCGAGHARARSRARAAVRARRTNQCADRRARSRFGALIDDTQRRHNGGRGSSSGRRVPSDHPRSGATRRLAARPALWPSGFAAQPWQRDWRGRPDLLVAGQHQPQPTQRDVDELGRWGGRSERGRPIEGIEGDDLAETQYPRRRFCPGSRPGFLLRAYTRSLGMSRLGRRQDAPRCPSGGRGCDFEPAVPMAYPRAST